MARWLPKIAPGKKRAEAPRPATFELVCVCGEPASGTRRPRYQQVLCGVCGEALFVLPSNVYPEPPPPEPARTPPSPKSREKTGESDLAGGDSEAESPPDAETPAVPIEPSLDETIADALEEASASRRKRRAHRKRRREEREAEESIVTRVPLRQRLARQLTPFRVVVVSTVFVIAATAAWQIHSRRVQAARREYDRVRKDAMAAIEEGDYVSAEHLLERATDAADLIGRTDAQANQLRRMRVETHALNNLTLTSFFEAVNRAAETGPDDVEEQFLLDFNERWLLLDAEVRREPRDDFVAWFIDAPMMVGDMSIQVIVADSELNRLKFEGTRGRAIFAAQVEGCRFARSSKGRRLIIQLRADTLSLWTSLELYAAAGFVDADQADDETTYTLEEQARVVGAEP